MLTIKKGGNFRMKDRNQMAVLASIFSTLALLVSIILPTSTYAAESNDNYSLTIMHMNDTHAHADLMPNMVTAIKEVRAADPNALLFNAGDVFSGTLYFNQFKGQADLALLNLMDIDAMIFGNHEFDLGSGENGHKSLSEFVSKANFPFLSANVDFSGDAYMASKTNNSYTESPEDGIVYNGMVKEVNGEKVGIFGLTTEDTANISSPVNVKFQNYIEKAKEAVAAFESKGINKIIAVTHIGYDSNPEMGNDLQLAKYVDGIDVIVGGHSHTQLNEPVVITADEAGAAKDPTVIVQAYQYSTLLGELKVDFDENGVVVGQAGQLIDVASKAADAEAAAVLAPYKAEIDSLTNQETGAVAKKPLLNPRLTDSEVSVRANETELGNLVTDAMLAKAKEKNENVVIAMQNGGGIRAAIDEGPITTGEVIAVLPFGNDPAFVQLTGEEIKQILEYSVRLAPAESGGFLHVSGMKFTYDSTKEAGSRVVSMQVKVNEQYEDIKADQTYLVTTNNFTAKGGDGYEVFAKAYQEGRVQDMGAIDWEQLRDYMVDNLNGEVDPQLEGRIIDTLGKAVEPETPVDEDDGNQDDDNGSETPVNDGDDNSDDDNGSETPVTDDNSDNGDDTPATDDDKTDDSADNGAAPGSDNDQNQNVTPDKTSDDKATSGNTAGNALPNTATNNYTMLLVGGLLFVVGIGVLVYRKVRHA